MFIHAKIKKLISAYLDGELKEKDKLLVENHLKECAECKKYYQELERVSFALIQDKGEDVSPDLEQRIRNNFLGDKYKREAKMKNKKLIIGISSGALAILLMFIFVGSMQGYLRKNVPRGLQFNSEQTGGQYSPGLTTQSQLGYSDNRESVSFSRAIPQTINGGRIGYTDEKSPWITAYTESAADYSTGGYPASKTIKIVSGNVKTIVDDQIITSQNEGPIVIVEPYLPATGQEEKIIRSADATIEVKDVAKAYDEVVKISTSKKGYLAMANFNQITGGKIVAQLVLRVPKSKFEETVDELRKLGEVKRFDLEGVDVSRQYNALVSELNTIKVVYDKIEQKLKEKKTDITGAMRLESELTPYAKSIEAIRNQLNQYDNLISLSTIKVNLEATSWKLLFQENLKDVQRRLAQILSGIVKGLINLLPLLLTLVCFTVVVAWIISIIKNALNKKSDK